MIFDSVLSRRGIIDSVYVNFPGAGAGAGAGWFRILPRFVTNFHDVTPGRLKQLLTDLFATGYILDSATNQQIWSRVNIQDVFDNFPHNTRIVGCLSGEAANNFVHYDEYIASEIQHDHSYVFVVGIFAGGIIERFIHENVKVSNYSLRTYNCISNIISGLQKKWNI
ncbi:uncharacterized protein LOC130809738 isoform X2 [Amaranthus tricolor]|nr:uncharacterized protein LOC130809738 isoform X2 [Amaranthus tricolor]